MKNELLTKISIVIGLLILSSVVFSLLQNKSVYEISLGRISSNYARLNAKEGSQIIETKKPFEKITSSNIYRWDAKLYKSISDSAYTNTDFYFKERLAFYPLFSVLWKVSNIDSPLIFIFNYLLFAFSLIWLLNLFKKSDTDNLFIFFIALILPSSMVYYLPYAESLFLFTFVAAIAGLLQKKYWLFFIGALAFSMTRPAAQIFIFAIIFSDIRYFLLHKNLLYFIKEVLLKALPFVLGIFLVTWIQYIYSGSWTAYFDSLTFWPVESGFSNKIVDWSVEGFGMTVFAIFFVAIPSLIYSIVWGIKVFGRKQNAGAQPLSLFSGDKEWIREYIFNTSVLFIAGNLIYTFLTSGNVLNGFYRYTMCVPSFYIVFFLCFEKIKIFPLKYKIITLGLCAAGMMVFLSNVIYGGDRFRFPYTGLYILVALFFLLIIEPYISYKKKWFITAVILIPAIIWHVYLFNVYLSDGWIFT
ncbi:MAG TPA: hypothetical protein VNY73_09795 [Bacteroidia bacterium]|nr:hypothetical protein [Bacteroidia bacterium]